MNNNRTRALLTRACATWALCGASVMAVAQAAGAAKPAAPATAAVPTAAEAGYLLGVNFGSQMQRIGVTNEVSIPAITRGIKDGLAGKKPNAADEQRLQVFVRSVMQASLARNEKVAQRFLTRNAKLAGVKTTASGLEYKVIAAGDTTAAAPAPTDTVTVQYRGRLADGTEFDSSYKRGQPATFPVNAVIKGWQEALVMMKPGARWELFVPPDLGYGSSPRPGIPPGSLLIFDVNLLSIKAAPAAPAEPPAPPAAPAAPPKTP